MDEKFRKRVQFLVDQAGGQSSLARAADMSLGAIQRYLKGGDPTRLALIKLAQAGDVSLSWLIYGEEGKMEVSSEGKPKYKMYGFSESSSNGWQEAFAYRVRTELDWPDPECFTIIARDDVLASEGIKKDFVCFVSPNTRAQPEDIIFIKNNHGAAGLKKYLREDQDWVYLEGFAGQTTYKEKLKQSEIDQIAPVVFVKRR